MYSKYSVVQLQALLVRSEVCIHSPLANFASGQVDE